MPDEHPKDPLHGMTLKAIVEALQARYGWAGLAERIDIGCFRSDPSVPSSLKFLRATPWARAQVEGLFVADALRAERNRKRNEYRALRRARAAAGEAVEGEEGEDIGDEGEAEGGEP